VPISLVRELFPVHLFLLSPGIHDWRTDHEALGTKAEIVGIPIEQADRYISIFLVFVNAW
jgi:hypothetical protein